ncbi:MAG: hypothetical protein AAFV53_39335 [Myxococcota bacterium]
MSKEIVYKGVDMDRIWQWALAIAVRRPSENVFDPLKDRGENGDNDAQDGLGAYIKIATLRYYEMINKIEKPADQLQPLWETDPYVNIHHTSEDGIYVSFALPD